MYFYTFFLCDLTILQKLLKIIYKHKIYSAQLQVQKSRVCV